jgi:hypothetical protein
MQAYGLCLLCVRGLAADWEGCTPGPLHSLLHAHDACTQHSAAALWLQLHPVFADTCVPPLLLLLLLLQAVREMAAKGLDYKKEIAKQKAARAAAKAKAAAAAAN